PPPAPVAQARQFSVYFRFDRYALTPEAKAVVKSAADYALSNNSHKVKVVGYTDTSGSAAYNIKLSQRRAGATAKALVASGVANADISVNWKGETDLAVPTADGVREPRNRRATIDIQF
ncbi:MAG: OmpA family protein, partial [Asticcacaulis sp.]|nr:OmpA family protein [Asticcacaulis sp.]